jgi:cytoskeletal protein CcmA (bactofilin family)
MIIGPQIVIDGELSCDEDLTIEGRARGYVSVREATLTIDAHARVEADLRAPRVLIRGEVRGAVAATERIELSAASVVEGSLSAGVIVIADGARFNGTIDMDRRTIAARVADYRAGANKNASLE